MPENLSKRAETLREQLNYHIYRYNVLSDPVITDAEYDKLYHELKSLEEAHPEFITPDSPTQRAGSDLSEDFDKVQHPASVLSLANAFNNDDLLAWEDRNRKLLAEDVELGYTLEPKLDGLTIVMTYENGVLTRAATRGNGEVGDDVTANVRTIKSVPLRIPVNPTGSKPPELLVVRGEVLFLLEDFNALNAEREAAGEPLYINPRNTASGSLKQKDSRITSSRPLTVYTYAIVESRGITLDTQWDILGYMLELGFQIVPEAAIYPNLSQIIQHLPTWQTRRNQLDFEIDGLVIKVNDLKLADELGVVGKDPRSAVAYKFPAQVATTRLNGVSVSVGRTGRVVPTAQLEPVFLGGVTVSNATLHNFDFVDKLDIRLGDRVTIKRSGDVIPYVIGPITGARTGEEKPITPPEKCPFSDDPLVRPDGAVDWYCPNPRCPERVFRSIDFFVSRGAMDIEGMGPQTVKTLIDEDLIHDEADIFTLKADPLLELEGFAEKKVENLLQSIDAARHRPLEQFLTSLGIEGVGNTVAALLARELGSINMLAHADAERLEAIDQIGPILAENIVAWFEDDYHREILNKMKAAGVNMEAAEADLESTALDGFTFVLTGALPTLSRDGATALIESHGGRVTGSVSKKTSFLLAGESPGSKLQKAEKNGVTVISEDDLRAFIANGGPPSSPDR